MVCNIFVSLSRFPLYCLNKEPIVAVITLTNKHISVTSAHLQHQNLHNLHSLFLRFCTPNHSNCGLFFSSETPPKPTKTLDFHQISWFRRKELMPGSYCMTWVLRPRGGHRRPVGYPDPYQNSGLAM